MTHETARKQRLEPVYPENTQEGQFIFYDMNVGLYYDSSTDLYLDKDFDPTTIQPRPIS